MRLKGGSLSRTELAWIGGKKFIRKSISSKENREYGLVRWHSQVRKIQQLAKHLPDDTVTIHNYGVSGDEYFFDLPYYEECQNCYQALVQSDYQVEMVSSTLSLLDKLFSVRYTKSKGALAIYIAEEMNRPLNVALAWLSSSNVDFSEEEISDLRNAIMRSINRTAMLQRKFVSTEIDESLTHGNLTLENLLWNSRDARIMMIDPYGETYCESILGDFSQLLQSSQSGYEYMCERVDSRHLKISPYPANIIPANISRFGSELAIAAKNKDWYSQEIVDLFYASQFIRMFPFKLVHSPRQAYFFLMHGIDLLEVIEC